MASKVDKTVGVPSVHVLVSDADSQPPVIHLPTLGDGHWIRTLYMEAFLDTASNAEKQAIMLKYAPRGSKKQTTQLTTL